MLTAFGSQRLPASGMVTKEGDGSLCRQTAPSAASAPRNNDFAHWQEL
jgi:hypothetical protein